VGKGLGAIVAAESGKKLTKIIPSVDDLKKTDSDTPRHIKLV
jgi:hypothetical protein